MGYGTHHSSKSRARTLHGRRQWVVFEKYSYQQIDYSRSINIAQIVFRQSKSVGSNHTLFLHSGGHKLTDLTEFGVAYPIHDLNILRHFLYVKV